MDSTPDPGDAAWPNRPLRHSAEACGILDAEAFDVAGVRVVRVKEVRYSVPRSSGWARYYPRNAA